MDKALEAPVGGAELRSRELETRQGVLSRAGLEVEQQRPNGQALYVIRGNTYPLNDCLEGAGAVWDSAEQAWIVREDQGIEALAGQLETHNPDLRRTALRESGARFCPPTQRESLVVRLLEAGPSTVTDRELLQLILSFGELLDDPESVSGEMLERLGSLSAVLAADVRTLDSFARLGDTAVALLRAVHVAVERVLHEPITESPVIGSWSALLDYLRVAFRHKKVEQLLVLYLDRKNRLIRDELHQHGTVDHMPLYPREVVKRALELAASAIILIHNHPSGDPTPSRTDVDMTRQVVRALNSVDIALHDHVIVGRTQCVSFRSQRLI